MTPETLIEAMLASEDSWKVTADFANTIYDLYIFIWLSEYRPTL